MNVKNDYVGRDCLLAWLKEHRHGVMGTVIFHLVLAISLVCVGISRLDSQQRIEIEIDMPTPEIVQQKQEEQERKEQSIKPSIAYDLHRLANMVKLPFQTEQKLHAEYLDQVQ